MSAKRALISEVVALLMLLASAGNTQSGPIMIPAGSPEDRALQAVTAEQDQQKKLALLNDFVANFASNPAAVAYGNSQISQTYQEQGDLAKALQYGDKALAALPGNLPLLASQAGIAQQLKDNAKALEYAVRGGEAYQKPQVARPQGMSDADYADLVTQQKEQLRPNFQYLEALAYNVISGESDAKTRMGYIERFTPAFPNSQFEPQVAQYAVYSLQELNDFPRLVVYGEKTLAANPNSLATLVMLASGYAEDPKSANLAKAIQYGRKAVELADASAAGATEARKLAAGVAYSEIGYALMKQEKTAAAIPELNKAAALLGANPSAYASVIYRAGFAYAKMKRYAEARAILNKAKDLETPYRKPIRELLAKIAGAKKG